jgi:hypothetical protein
MGVREVIMKYGSRYVRNSTISKTMLPCNEYVYVFGEL